MRTNPRLRPQAVIGNTDIVDAVPGHNQELIIITKPEGGTTNIALIDENGEQVANVLVTNPTIQYQPARSQTGMQVYRTKTSAGLSVSGCRSQMIARRRNAMI
jgi:Flp pilus assembly secretin CpaC